MPAEQMPAIAKKKPSGSVASFETKAARIASRTSELAKSAEQCLSTSQMLPMARRIFATVFADSCFFWRATTNCSTTAFEANGSGLTLDFPQAAIFVQQVFHKRRSSCRHFVMIMHADDDGGGGKRIAESWSREENLHSRGIIVANCRNRKHEAQMRGSYLRRSFCFSGWKGRRTQPHDNINSFGSREELLSSGIRFAEVGDNAVKKADAVSRGRVRCSTEKSIAELGRAEEFLSSISATSADNETHEEDVLHDCGILLAILLKGQNDLIGNSLREEQTRVNGAITNRVSNFFTNSLD
jgi:hypothetical protein